MGHYDWDATGYPIFYVHGLSGPEKTDRNKLDALLVLFEAAPELLAACKTALAQMVTTVAPRHAFTDAVDALDAAIAKAEGR